MQGLDLCLAVRGLFLFLQGSIKMANAAVRDQEKRVVEVNRERLLETLHSNKRKHVQEYQEAMQGYKSILLDKIKQEFQRAAKQLIESQKSIESKVASFTDEDISKQRDYFTIVDAISIEMKVPRSYEKEYNAAIDIASWDVNETMELTHAEFTCFVRDEWDWKQNFEAISAIYKAAKI